MHYLTVKLCGLYDDYSLRYEGEWKQNLPHGDGMLFDRNGTVLYNGQWENGVYHISEILKYDYSKDKWIFSYDDLIYIGKPIELDEGKFKEQLKRLEEEAISENADVRRVVKEIVPTYQYQENV